MTRSPGCGAGAACSRTGARGSSSAPTRGYATHKHAEVRAWLAKNPRVRLHFVPTGCSWLNLVECFFSVITRQAIRRGSFTSVRQLTDTIGAFIDSWNDHPHPFAWTKDAEAILASISRAKNKPGLGHMSRAHHRARLARAMLAAWSGKAVRVSGLGILPEARLGGPGAGSG